MESTEATGSDEQDPQLQRGLKPRHLSMIAIGGVIGAGLFVGSGAVIAAAGPASWSRTSPRAILVVFVMRMLGEMAAANPTRARSPPTPTARSGRWAGFTIGWLYWFFWVVVLAVEATAGAEILQRWIRRARSGCWALV